jgi:hypothetical protein
MIRHSSSYRRAQNLIDESTYLGPGGRKYIDKYTYGFRGGRNTLYHISRISEH